MEDAMEVLVLEVVADMDPGGPSSALMVAELSLSILRRLPCDAESGLLEDRDPGGSGSMVPGITSPSWSQPAFAP